jgi:transposase
MAVAPDDFASWLAQADIPTSYRTPQLEALLQAVFRFRQQQGSDYYSTRLLSHFLLHADTGLKVAQVARLLGISRPNASKQQKLSSKEAIRQAHHRMDGRPHGKLLPRYVGPIAAFLLGHPDASRAELLAFIERTFGVRVSRIALYKYLKKYGLQDVCTKAVATVPANPAVDSCTAVPVQPASAGPAPLVAAGLSPAAPLAAPAAVIELACASAAGRPSPPPFCSDGRNTPVPSC